MNAQLLPHLHPYIAISPDLEERLGSILKQQTVRKDRIIKSSPLNLIFVNQGLFMRINDDTGHVQHFMKGEDFIIYPEDSWHESIVALQDSEIFVLDVQEQYQLMSDFPHLIPAYDRLYMYWYRQRLLREELLLLSAAERKGTFLKHFKGYAHLIPLKYICSYLHILPTYYSRL
ncbi:hypothetical protein [Sphingobacterium sp. SYP-B4668]|uniref:hypothetical protein n=1 Tax=Sphingobacterium sp. SYP-B4668 TaxID=2996035 RepID=UPI0022DD7DE7|nr:hypothetical protein [Sphingobacterium sp. SYP-B4668]